MSTMRGTVLFISMHSFEVPLKSFKCLLTQSIVYVNYISVSCISDSVMYHMANHMALKCNLINQMNTVMKQT